MKRSKKLHHCKVFMFESHYINPGRFRSIGATTYFRVGINTYTSSKNAMKHHYSTFLRFGASDELYACKPTAKSYKLSEMENGNMAVFKRLVLNVRRGVSLANGIFYQVGGFFYIEFLHNIGAVMFDCPYTYKEEI